LEIEEAFTTYLLSQDALTALIGNRLFPEEIPQLDTLPAVSYIKISDVKDHLLSGQSPLERPIFQFTVFASTKAEARNVAKQLKTALVDYTGDFGEWYDSKPWDDDEDWDLMDGYVQYIQLQNEITNLERIDNIKIYTENLEFQINYE